MLPPPWFPTRICAPPPLPQWFVLNRKHAELVLSDQAVEGLFQLNCYTSLERANGKMWERVCYSGAASQRLCSVLCFLPCVFCGGASRAGHVCTCP